MKYRHYESIDSTNNEAKRLIRSGELKDSEYLVADMQTAGRGRQGKSFFSPDTGLYMTVVLPVGQSIDSQVSMTTKTAVAVARSIEKVTGIIPGIKWVNDIYVRGKKCCGILCEAVNDYEKGIMEYLIAGIGINIYTSEWPEELRDIAGSLYDEDMSDRFTIIREQLAEEIASELEILIKSDDTAFLKYYKDHSVVIGKRIMYLENDIKRFGTAVDIDGNGGLMVVDETDREIKILNSGEITVRMKGCEKMRFFITENDRQRLGSTAFIEFQKGEYDGSCWHIDSLCMSEDIFADLKLRRFFTMYLPQFDYYGLTQVTGSEFEKLLDMSKDFSTDVYSCMTELKNWAGDKEGDEILFTICGM